MSASKVDPLRQWCIDQAPACERFGDALRERWGYSHDFELTSKPTFIKFDDHDVKLSAQTLDDGDTLLNICNIDVVCFLRFKLAPRGLHVPMEHRGIKYMFWDVPQQAIEEDEADADWDFCD